MEKTLTPAQVRRAVDKLPEGLKDPSIAHLRLYRQILEKWEERGSVPRWWQEPLKKALKLHEYA